MTDYQIMGKNPPYTPYIKLIFDGFSTDVIPPKYILSFECNRIGDKVGNFTSKILSMPNTFEAGDDIITTKLSAAFSKLAISADSSATDKVNCKVEYGWFGVAASRMIYNNCVVSTFEADNDGTRIIYTITGTLNQCEKRGYQTAIDSDYNGDSSVNVIDLVAAKKSGSDGDYSSIKSSLVYGDMSSLTIIPAGRRMSDVVEYLANYIFGNDYDVQVTHDDQIYNEDTPIKYAVTNVSEYSPSTLMNKLECLIKQCRTYKYESTTVKYTDKKSGYTWESEYANPPSDAEINKEIAKTKKDDSMYDANKDGSVNLLDVINSKKSGGDSKTIAQALLTGNTSSSKAEIEYTVTDNVSYGSYYDMYFVDKPGKNGKSIIKICPSDGLNSNSSYFNYIVSNKNATSNVINFTLNSDYVAFIAGVNQVMNNASVSVNSNTGEVAISKIISGDVSIDQKDVKAYAEAIATQVIDNVAAAFTGSLEVFADIKSSYIGVTDWLTITSTVNNGKTLTCGDYFVTEVRDSINETGYKTTFSIKFLRSSAVDTLISYITKCLNEVVNKK